MIRRRLLMVGAAVVLGAAGVGALTPLGRDLWFHAVPIRWTGEADRLAVALRLQRGGTVADLGAGSGVLAVELSRIVGLDGRVFATERTPEQRRRIAGRIGAAGITNVTIIEAGEQSTNLPDICCDAVTMRMVMHHVADPAVFAADVRRTLIPGGRAAIIDFAPGALPHLEATHGLAPDGVRAAFEGAGFVLETRAEDWGGRSYLLVFRAP